MQKKSFYITTPIYYPSDKLHIGHSYTTVAADAMARFKRLTGHQAYFLTGTDEHGQKIERRAQEAGKEPQEFVDEIVDWIKKLWTVLDISYDDFIRTTEQRHKDSVQKIFTKFYEQGDIYKSKYEGWYCTPCEAFWTERQVEEGNCPDCKRPVELVAEESYFFKMSKYADRLIEHIENNPEFIQPASRKNEMINNFLKPGLEDLCVSRTTFKWGIPVPFDPDHVIYVWLDALSNYITALGYFSEDDSKMEAFWPADVQLIGKEIVRFHTIYWPIFLMALGLELPKQVFGHGWLLLEEGKMSKSKGNVIDPEVLVERYGSDAIRYFLLREIPFGADGHFSEEALIQRLNFDLANDLGNLLNRTLAMLNKYYQGKVPTPSGDEAIDQELKSMALDLPQKMTERMDQLLFSNALSELWKFIARANKYIDETAPWTLAKEGNQERLATVMYNLLESIRIVSVLLLPFMPRTPERIWQQLGIAHEGKIHTWDSIQEFGALPAGAQTKAAEVLFPRLELTAEGGGPVRQATKKDKPVQAPKEDKKKMAEKDGLITIDDFARVDLRIAEVKTAEKVEGADKLLKLTVSLGEQERQVVAGIAQHYGPETLTGKQVLFVANLKPVKLRGIRSEGMLLAASDSEGKLVLVGPQDSIAAGSKVK
ncbi:methionine--tRNA ligase [Dethiobacter alkaliphilus]|uniref:methionine--tRNA ligase n=1 Tax=Dethiobacter alkaliphilus TaxID=427926 RepID=UPI002225D5E0|nr:methionine--tRNA ligase [Dethiobacter alkaliphilus]MCW3489097.1 methionine--tRNA ligase [Dethiobacter alkaliphilus]